MFSFARLTGVLAALVALSASVVSAQEHWVDIWGSMPQLVEYSNMPNPPYNGTNVTFQNSTLRQTFYITQDASMVRLQISNAFGVSDLPITAATIALPLNGSAGTSAINTDTLRTLTFSGQPNFTIPDGALVVSDPVPFTVKAQSVVTVSLYLATGQTTNYITGHPGSRTTTYMAPGNLVASEDIAAAGGNATQTQEHWYFASAIQGWLPAANGAFVIVGDSITDGRESTENANNRWPDQLLARMQADPATSNIAVVNQAAGGNRILYDGNGPNALGRIDRDVLSVPGVQYAMIFEGVNDIGTCATDPADQESMGTRVITAYDQIITRVHAFGIPIFGATITPFSGPGEAYSDPEREVQRQRINTWIRESGRFDAVVDFDAAMRDPTNSSMLNPLYNSGDWLHPNPQGYGVMAAAFDLAVFAQFANGVSSIV